MHLYLYLWIEVNFPLKLGFSPPPIIPLPCYAWAGDNNAQRNFRRSYLFIGYVPLQLLNFNHQKGEEALASSLPLVLRHFKWVVRWSNTFDGAFEFPSKGKIWVLRHN